MERSWLTLQKEEQKGVFFVHRARELVAFRVYFTSHTQQICRILAAWGLFLNYRIIRQRWNGLPAAQGLRGACDDCGERVMSLDQVSQNNTPMSASAPHLAKVDTFVRRSASNDSPSLRTPRNRGLPPVETPAVQRRYP